MRKQGLPAPCARWRQQPTSGRAGRRIVLPGMRTSPSAVTNVMNCIAHMDVIRWLPLRWKARQVHLVAPHCSAPHYAVSSIRVHPSLVPLVLLHPCLRPRTCVPANEREPLGVGGLGGSPGGPGKQQQDASCSHFTPHALSPPGILHPTQIWNQKGLDCCDDAGALPGPACGGVCASCKGSASFKKRPKTNIIDVSVQQSANTCTSNERKAFQEQLDESMYAHASGAIDGEFGGFVTRVVLTREVA